MVPALPRTSLVSRSQDLLEATVGHEIVLLSIEHGSYHALDAVAAAVWQRLKKPITIEALCAALTEEFDVTAAQCETDVLAFLDELRKQDLIVVGAGNAAGSQ